MFMGVVWFTSTLREKSGSVSQGQGRHPAAGAQRGRARASPQAGGGAGGPERHRPGGGQHALSGHHRRRSVELVHCRCIVFVLFLWYPDFVVLLHVVVVPSKFYRVYVSGCVYSWGRNDHGQLGETGSVASKQEPSLVSLLEGKYIIGVACGPAQVFMCTTRTLLTHLLSQVGYCYFPTADQIPEVLTWGVKLSIY